MAYTFRKSSFARALPWDTSNVTTMKGMFYGASVFNSTLALWDVARVGIMGSMFFDATSFHGEGLAAWDVSNVYDMAHMFESAIEFDEVLLYTVHRTPPAQATACRALCLCLYSLNTPTSEQAQSPRLPNACFAMAENKTWGTSLLSLIHRHHMPHARSSTCGVVHCKPASVWCWRRNPCAYKEREHAA